jgi:hypothetical protein
MHFKRTVAAAIGGLIMACSFAESQVGSAGYAVADNSRSKAVPIQNWSPAAFNSKQTRTTGERSKAATDFATVFRPVTPCRLIDTRAGQPSAQGNIGGTIAGGAGTRRTVDLTTSPCGIPNISEVKALSLAFAVFNNTPNNGGFLAFTSPAAAPTGFNLIFSPGQQWLGTTAAVVTGGVGGDFDVFATTSVIDLIVDVNGYYQEMGELDVGTQQLDFHGTTSGDVLGIDNTGTGTALSVFSSTATGGTSIRTGAFGTGAKSIDSTGGKFNVSGANTVAGTNFVYIHRVTAASLVGVCATIRTNLDHPMLNGNPNAVVFAMAYGNLTTPPTQVTGVELVGTGNSCTAANNWRLVVQNPVIGTDYAIFIVTNN